MTENTLHDITIQRERLTPEGISWEALGIEKLSLIFQKYNNILSEEFGVRCNIIPVGSILQTRLLNGLSEHVGKELEYPFQNSSDLDIVVMFAEDINPEKYNEAILRLNIQEDFNQDLSQYNIQLCNILNFDISEISRANKNPISAEKILEHLEKIESFKIMEGEMFIVNNLRYRVSEISKYTRILVIAQSLYQLSDDFSLAFDSLIKAARSIDKEMGALEETSKEFYLDQMLVYSGVGKARQLELNCAENFVSEIMINPIPSPNSKHIRHALGDCTNEVLYSYIENLSLAGIEVL